MALSTTQYGYIIDPMVPFTDDKGKTIKNGFVRVFVAGSSTPVVTYRNFDGATNQDRIELDNSGRTKTSVIGSKGFTYKVCVYDKHHSQESPILTVDKVSVIGANITAGAGATVVTGLDGLTTKPDGFVDASVVGTDGYVALDHTLVTDDLDTDAKVTAVEDDRYVPLLNEDVNDPDSKMTLGRLWQWVLGKIKSLSTTITSFRTGDVIPVDGPSGTAKMSKDNLLQVTADNALGSIHLLSDTATEADLVVGNFLAIDVPGVGGATKKIPGNMLPACKIIDRGNATVAAINAKTFMQDGWIYFVLDAGTITLGNFAVNAGDTIRWDAANSVWVKYNNYVNRYAYARRQDLSKTTTSTGEEFKFYDKIKQGDLVKVIFNYTLSVIWVGVKYEGESTETILKEARQPGEYSFVAEQDIGYIRTFAQGVEKGAELESSLIVIPAILKNEFMDVVKNYTDGKFTAANLTNFHFEKSKEATFTDVEIRFDSLSPKIPKGYTLEIHTPGSFTTCFLAVTYPGGEVASVAQWGQGEAIHKYTLTDECSAFRFYMTSVTSGTTYSVEVNANALLSSARLDSMQEEIDELSAEVADLSIDTLSGTTFSIIGDSYSTYKNWIPENNSSWYAVNGVDGANYKQNNVDSVKDCWWYKLSKEMGCPLILNESYSGSTICNTGYNGGDSTSTSFITRADRACLDAAKNGKIKPCVIIVFGGTNDSWANVPIGEIQYSGWATADLKKFLPAACYLFDSLLKWNPQAKILNVVNTGLKAEIVAGFEEITEHYGVENLELADITKENGHPNKAGMTAIYNQIKAVLLSML